MGSIAVYLFFFMDFSWYHRLLLGAVWQGIEIEKRHADVLPELSITKMIGSTSPIVPTGFLWLLSKIFVRDSRFREQGKLHSDAKIKLFYYTIICFLLLLFIVSSLTKGIEIDGKNLFQRIADIICN